ncbi:aldo/keto reductase [Entomobacter blattae]|uniref:Putative oxidoreductase n=1 Tax=Entomobacter blattae TaxID=2762277 RepID=A0A7H1NV02_9PROT|nr:aldo/keto reductase [Entomobacter blattae]QNT79612.1 putative oxidoreductase [Entomobacter blattae]
MNGLPKVYAAHSVSVPVLGQGTWNMGDNPALRQEEIASLQYGIDYGLSVIDTAEMYGNGASERLVGEAIAGRRDKVFLVTKVLPSNASKEDVAQSCRKSLKRLGVDYVDLYLLHWAGRVPISETVEAFVKLCDEGLIKAWGVSNFDVAEMQTLEDLHTMPSCFANQVLYSLDHRGIEYDLLAYNRQKEVITMAYSPLGQGGRMLHNPVLQQVAARHITTEGQATPAQIALAWVLRQPDVLAIPKAGTLKHMTSNILSLEISLTERDMLDLDKAFAPPKKKWPLAML